MYEPSVGDWVSLGVLYWFFWGRSTAEKRWRELLEALRNRQ